MAKIKNPKRFSDAFNIDEKVLKDQGLLNPLLNVDTKLFVDPLLLVKSSNSIISGEGYNQYIKYFENIIKLLKKSKRVGDEAWKASKILLMIEEVQGTSLGYGVGSTTGRKLPNKILDKIIVTAKEIVDIGIDDPELFILLPLIQEGIGPDLISDFTTSIIEPQLLKLTIEFAKENNLPISEYDHPKLGKIECLMNPLVNIPVLLLPSDILSKLPTASDWSGVRDASCFNHYLRRRVNNFIAEIWTKKAKKDKERFKDELLKDKTKFEEMVRFIKELSPKPYNLEKDEKGLLLWHEWLEKTSVEYPFELETPEKNVYSLGAFVGKIIKQYQFLIEERGLNKLLWKDGKRVPEKVSQMLLFAVSYSYCKANDIDINTEVDAGTGLIDFKFSYGFSKRIIVEVKLTTNDIVHGYMRQLEIYKDSEETSIGYFIVIDVGSVGKKLDNLRRLENLNLSEIIVIDGNLKLSASKRK